MSASIDKELLEKLLQEATAAKQPMQTAAYLAGELRKIDEIQTQLASIQKQRCALEQKHKNALQDLMNKETEARKQCKHRCTTYHGDASGGSDSFSTCNHCGANINKERPYRRS